MMFKKKENNINLEDLKEILDKSVNEAITNIESKINEENKKDELTFTIFSLQNKMAIREYKSLLEQKLGLKEEK